VVEGSVDELGQALVPLTLIGTRGTVTVQALVDTGFLGAVMVPVPIAVHLGLELVSVEPFELADGTVVEEFVFRGRVRLGTEEAEVPFLLTRSEQALLGTQLLEGQRLTINYQARTVMIS
jgi:clan AA aspartic protease